VLRRVFLRRVFRLDVLDLPFPILGLIFNRPVYVVPSSAIYTSFTFFFPGHVLHPGFSDALIVLHTYTRNAKRARSKIQSTIYIVHIKTETDTEHTIQCMETPRPTIDPESVHNSVVCKIRRSEIKKRIHKYEGKDYAKMYRVMKKFRHLQSELLEDGYDSDPNPYSPCFLFYCFQGVKVK
jgi:hypothetical protein